MDEQTKKDLLAKREQVQVQLRQAEADTYFFQGQINLIDEMLSKEEEPEATTDKKSSGKEGTK